MQAFAADTKKDRLSIVWTGDPAVAPDPDPPRAPEGRPETAEEKAAREAWKPPSEVYAATLDRSALTITGEPRVYHCRPLGAREQMILAELTFGGVALAAVAYDVLGTAIVEVTGPHPMTEAKVRSAKSRSPSTGLTCIPDGSPLWDDVQTFPPSAVIDVALTYMRHQGEVSVAAKN